MHYCMNHPLVETDRFCSRCRRPVCGDCLVPLKGRDVCAECKHATLSAKFRAHPVHHPASAGSWGQSPAAYPAAPQEYPAVPQAYPNDYSMGDPASAQVAWGGVAAVPSSAYPAYSAAPVLGNCAYHPNNPAYATCERCGDFTCGLCVTAFDGRNYCVRCIDLMWQRGSLEAARFSEPGTALLFGIIGAFIWIIPFYGLIPPLVALGLGITALRKIAAQPELPGKKKAVVGLTLGVLSLLCTVGFWAWTFSRAVR